MPAQHLIPNWSERDATIRNLKVFNDRLFTREVLPPVLRALGVTLNELRDARRCAVPPTQRASVCETEQESLRTSEV
jgi:hypothetical protein